jgi:hypothetical protein
MWIERIGIDDLRIGIRDRELRRTRGIGIREL